MKKWGIAGIGAAAALIAGLGFMFYAKASVSMTVKESHICRTCQKVTEGSHEEFIPRYKVWQGELPKPVTNYVECQACRERREERERIARLKREEAERKARLRREKEERERRAFEESVAGIEAVDFSIKRQFGEEVHEARLRLGKKGLFEISPDLITLDDYVEFVFRFKNHSGKPVTVPCVRIEPNVFEFKPVFRWEEKLRPKFEQLFGRSGLKINLKVRPIESRYHETRPQGEWFYTGSGHLLPCAGIDMRFRKDLKPGQDITVTGYYGDGKHWKAVRSVVVRVMYPE